MKLVLRSMLVFAWIGWIGADTTLAEEQTWTGHISVSVCGKSHTEMASQVAYTDRQCTLACVDAGAPYVFVTDTNAVVAITNQDFGGLREYAADTVKLTGEQKLDGIVVAKIELIKKSE